VEDIVARCHSNDYNSVKGLNRVIVEVFAA
jgi:hypothetical protein